jgi:peptidoglycan/xylan/chitin deacetylase (PgdA/CDA1 family)
MTGTITISIEIELGWGMHDMGVFSHLSEDRSAEETALRRILNFSDKNDIQISFDVVGHLYRDSCNGSHEGPYPNSWWENDPGTDKKIHPQFYAPELIESIIDCQTTHEICTHTYSHILAKDMSDDLVRHELQLVRDVHERWDMSPPSSIVMPRHQSVDYELLEEFDIRTIRRPLTEYGLPDANPVRKLWWMISRDHPECELSISEGIIETTCTPHPSLAGTVLPSGQGDAPLYFRFLPLRVRERIHRRYLIGAIERAAQENSHVHLWTHLHNIANDSQWRAIEPALEHLAKRRDEEKVEIQKMCDLPEIVQ